MTQRAPLETPQAVRRGLGSPVLFSIVQGFISAALYFSLGFAAERALGWTWAVYLAAALFFATTVLSYVEGASLHQERGGATVMARFAFNELWSFVAGWAILLDYVILLALTAFGATDYVAVFWGALATGIPEVLLGGAIVAGIALFNVRGFEPRTFERSAWVVLADLALQGLLIAVGLALLLQPEVLTNPTAVRGSPGVGDLLFAFTLAIVAFAGLDASSGFAGQVAVSRRGLRRLVQVRMVAVLVPYLGITLLASASLGLPNGLNSGARDDHDAPMLGVVAAFEQEWLREIFKHLVAASAVVVLVTAGAAAMLGLSRLGYSLALNRQIPSAVGRLHREYHTPVVLIAAGAILAFALLVPGDIEFLVGIYAFGATIAFTLVHLSVVVLRRREPERDRPFRMPLNVRIGQVSWPIPAVVGVLVSVVSFGAVLWLHEGARIIGPVWMLSGVAMYVYYRRSQGKHVFRRVTVPERTLTRTTTHEAEYGSILVPIMGGALDDDIVQTAGRLAGKERPDEEAEGAQIEAMWVFVIPVALPLDARLPEGERKRALAALARAKAVGEEYEGVEVNTFTVRARSAGAAIVGEAKRRGVEAIVMPAEEPTRVRGGMVLGGKQGLRDTFVGETTRYVINRAPCRVVLTAPPSEARAAEAPAEAEPRQRDPMRPLRRRRARRPLQTPDQPQDRPPFEAPE